MKTVIHYEEGVSYIKDDDGWRVEAGCGALLAKSDGSANPVGSALHRITPELKRVNCTKCKQVYALEFLALVP